VGLSGKCKTPRPARFSLHFLMAIESISRKVLRRPIQSTQYRSFRCTEHLTWAGIEAFVGSPGDAYHNALAESVIGLLHDGSHPARRALERHPQYGARDARVGSLD